MTNLENRVITTVIWDNDGTSAKSEDVIIEIVRELPVIYPCLHLKRLTDEDIRHLKGKSSQEIMRDILKLRKYPVVSLLLKKGRDLYDEKSEDLRVPLTPGAVSSIVDDGNEVYLLEGAGMASGFSDREYELKGAKVVYSDEAIKAAAELSARYIQDRHLPDKAIDVIDEAGAWLRLYGKAEAGSGAKRKEKSRGGTDDKAEKRVTVKEIEMIIAKMAKIPERSVSSAENEKLSSLEEELKEQVYGQDQAITRVVRAIRASRAGFRDEGKPVASFLFVGPTGVGKTELARQLAGIMGITLLRFDMSEYQERHTVARLIGAPPGYVGYEEGEIGRAHV